LGHRKKCRLLLGRNAHEGCEGGEMFALPHCHVLGKVVEVDGGEYIGFL
jgi:hypothetical protein